jgi:hypothetical protein
MLEVLQFIFQDFWHWFGSFLIILVIASGIGGIPDKIRG